MQKTPPKLLLLLLATAVFLPGNSAVGARSRSRNGGTPDRMGRAADPDIPPAGPAVQFSDGSQDPNGTAALAMIQFPWQNLGYRVSFLGRRPGYRALTLVDRRQIEVYVKSEEGPDALAFDLAHEFGHIVDLKYNGEQQRKRWLELRGIDPATPWYGCSACSDYDTPAGDFAETFAYLLLGPGSFHSHMAPPPPPEKVRELAELCRIGQVSNSVVGPQKTFRTSR
jgi:hypothetical protein